MYIARDTGSARNWRMLWPAFAIVLLLVTLLVVEVQQATRVNETTGPIAASGGSRVPGSALRPEGIESNLTFPTAAVVPTPVLTELELLTLQHYTRGAGVWGTLGERRGVGAHVRLPRGTILCSAIPTTPLVALRPVFLILYAGSYLEWGSGASTQVSREPRQGPALLHQASNRRETDPKCSACCLLDLQHPPH